MNTSTICDSIELATKKILAILNCKYVYSYPKTAQSFPFKEADKLTRICRCIKDYEHANIQSIQNSDIPIQIDENTLKQLKTIITCIESLVQSTRKEMATSICKLLEYSPANHLPVYVTHMSTRYTFDEMIANNAYLRLYDFNKRADSTDVLNKVQQIAIKYKNTKFGKLLSNFNMSEHSYILQNCRFIFAYKNIYTNMFIIMPVVYEMYTTIDNCINASFDNIHPQLVSLIHTTCLEIENICGEQLSTVGGEVQNFNVYIEYEEVNKNLFKAFLKLASLAKELEYLTEIIVNTNQTQLLNTFWHLISLSIYGKVLFTLYSPQFQQFISKHTSHTLFVNNCVYSHAFGEVANMLHVKHESLRGYIQQFITNIRLISNKHQQGIYLRIPDINNHSVIITLIMGLYNQFLHETNPVT